MVPVKPHIGLDWRWWGGKLWAAGQLLLAAGMVLLGLHWLDSGAIAMAAANGPLGFCRWLRAQPEPNFLQALLTSHAGAQVAQYAGRQVQVALLSGVHLVVGLAVLVTGADGVIRTVPLAVTRR
jgi:hypothetical protein